MAAPRGGRQRPGRLLALGLADPDRFIAEHNVDRWQQTGKIDTGYLHELSADAVPALLRLPPSLGACAVGGLAEDLAVPESWHNRNASRVAARARIGDLHAAVNACPHYWPRH